MPYFVKKPVKVRAEKWDPSKDVPGIETRHFDGHTTSKTYGLIETDCDRVRIYPGYWIVFEENGEMYAYTQEKFEELYEFLT